MKSSIGIMLVWRFAENEAAQSEHEFIEPEHFIQALTRSDLLAKEETLKRLIPDENLRQATAAELAVVRDSLVSLGINAVVLRRSLRAKLGKGKHPHEKAEPFHRSERCRRAFASAAVLAAEAGARHVEAPHLLCAILQQKIPYLTAAIQAAGGNAEALVKAIGEHLQMAFPATHAPKSDANKPASDTPFLDRYGRDLTAEAKAGKLGPIIGRRKEILQVIQTLARKTKSNPVLIGEPGVGKTAIVEALAQRIADGKDTKVLGGKRIVEMNMGALVAGTKYRGEFEDRLKQLLAEVKADPQLIVFIDEIHTVVGAGDSQGRLDAANLMKPALARGEIKCIGATTTDEYRKYIEKDPALERRFNKIIVEESSRDEAVQILEGLKPHFEKHHKVRIGNAAIRSAVDLAIRFDADHRLPDKAIDLLDLACAQLCVPELSIQGKYSGGSESVIGELFPASIVVVLAEKTGISEEIIAGAIGTGAGAKATRLQDRVLRRVMGQDDAVGRVCNRLLLAHAALGERRGPLGVFLFLGPSGVGKTELARALAEALFGSESSLIRLDMSEYMEPHSVSRLVGSPPGYIGHDEEGQLTGQLRSKPYSIVLLDEVEKAHPRVLDIFLQVFDEGRITDSKGRVVDASNAIFIMTSNIGGGPQAVRKPIGFNAGPELEKAVTEKIGDDLKGHFRLEMINRMDEIIRFLPLTQTVMDGIAQHMLDGLAEVVRRKYGRELRFGDGVAEYLGKKAYSPEFGARNLHRVIQESIELPLAKWIANESDGQDILCRLEADKISLLAEQPSV